MASRATLPLPKSLIIDAGPVSRLMPLFAAYVAGENIERAAVGGFDRHGRLCRFAEIAGDAHAVADILPAIRSVLAETDVIELVLAHNHPAGASTPSPRDLLTTDRLAALARLAGAMLVDHLIFGDDGVFSMSTSRRVSAQTDWR